MTQLQPSMTDATTMDDMRVKPSTAHRLRRALSTASRFRVGVISGVFLLLLTIMAISAPVIAPYNPFTTKLLERMKPPFWMDGGSMLHLLGTDGVGRDTLSRLIYGARISLLVAAVSTVVAITIGLFLGIAAGYLGGLADAVISTLVNIMLTFPFVLLALAVVSVLGSGLVNVIVVLGITGWAGYTRVARADTMRLKQMEFAQAARVIGAGNLRIAVRHILPNLMSAMVVLSTVQLGRIIIAEAFLSFLGMGVKPPTPSWGGMLGESRVFMFDQWWLATFPGVMILLTSLAFNLVGDSLRDYLDPYTKNL
jgi:peptide/nickel transport system permease protein